MFQRIAEGVVIGDLPKGDLLRGEDEFFKLGGIFALDVTIILQISAIVVGVAAQHMLHV